MLSDVSVLVLMFTSSQGETEKTPANINPDSFHRFITKINRCDGKDSRATKPTEGEAVDVNTSLQFNFLLLQLI